ncbi:hypothetical protein ACVI1L_004844 [Bradyrhizobium sp. USDA 4516]
MTDRKDVLGQKEQAVLKSWLKPYNPALTPTRVRAECALFYRGERHRHKTQVLARRQIRRKTGFHYRIGIKHFQVGNGDFEIRRHNFWGAMRKTRLQICRRTFL